MAGNANMCNAGTTMQQIEQTGLSPAAEGFDP